MSTGRALLDEMLEALEREPALAERARRALGIEVQPAPEPTPVYLAVPQYAKRLGVSERTAWTWARAGLPCIGSGRTRRVVVADADRWLSERRGAVDDAVERQARAAATRAARRATR